MKNNVFLIYWRLYNDKKIQTDCICYNGIFLFMSCNNNYPSKIKPEQKTKGASIAVTGIYLVPNENTVSLVKGTSRQLKAQVKPDRATDKRLTFSSSNEDIASVTADKTITAHELGDAIITIKAANNVSKQLEVIVTAESVPVKKYRV